MTGNKVLGSSAPRAVFVFLGGMGAPLLPAPLAPKLWCLATPPRLEVRLPGWPPVA